MFKLCPRCNTEKDLSMYHKSSSLKYGVQTYCKQCQSTIDKAQVERRKRNGPTIIRNNKICQICKNNKPISQFGVRKNSADGHLSYCKPCWTTYVKAKQQKR